MSLADYKLDKAFTEGVKIHLDEETCFLVKLPSQYNRAYTQAQYEHIALEIDEDVIYLANKYVLDDLDSPVEIITGDAYHFMALNQAKFDLVIMDVFEDADIPVRFDTDTFMEDLENSLAPKGLVLYNRLTSEPSKLRQTEKFFTRFKEYFPDAGWVTVEGNRVIFNHQRFFK